jgi:hypothetical protein
MCRQPRKRPGRSSVTMPTSSISFGKWVSATQCPKMARLIGVVSSHELHPPIAPRPGQKARYTDDVSPSWASAWCGLICTRCSLVQFACALVRESLLRRPEFHGGLSTHSVYCSLAAGFWRSARVSHVFAGTLTGPRTSPPQGRRFRSILSLRQEEEAAFTETSVPYG